MKLYNKGIRMKDHETVHDSNTVDSIDDGGNSLNESRDVNNYAVAEQKTKSKKVIKLIIICFAIIAAVAIIGFGGYIVLKEIGIRQSINKIEAVSNLFESGEKSYNESLKFLDSFKDDSNQRIVDAVSASKSELEILKVPTQSYFDGLDKEEKGEYWKAVTFFEKVTDSSNNYNAAQTKLKNLKDKAAAEVEQIASDYVKNNNYDTAIENLERFNAIYSDNRFDDNIKTIEQAKAEYLAKKQAEEEARKAAEEKRKAEEEAAKIAEIRSILRISRCWTSGPDSANGYELYINWTNKSEKTVKYFVFGVKFIDPVGEPISSWSIDTIEYCKDTGPFGPGKGRSGSGWHWGKYYDAKIDHPELVYVRVDYMDGTSWFLSKEEIQAVQY